MAPCPPGLCAREQHSHRSATLCLFLNRAKCPGQKPERAKHRSAELPPRVAGGYAFGRLVADNRGTAEAIARSLPRSGGKGASDGEAGPLPPDGLAKELS